MILPVSPLLQVRIMPVELSRSLQHGVSAASQPLPIKRVFVAAPEEICDLGRCAEDVCDWPIRPGAQLGPDPTPLDPIPSFIPVPTAGVRMPGARELPKTRRPFLPWLPQQI